MTIQPAAPTTNPQYWGWFNSAELVQMTPEEITAYQLPDYPGPRGDEGIYCDLYADDGRADPIGRLWTANGNRAGLVHVPDEDGIEYARVALRLRLQFDAGVPAKDAFDAIVEEYTTGEVFQGPLEDIADPSIDENDGI